MITPAVLAAQRLFRVQRRLETCAGESGGSARICGTGRTPFTIHVLEVQGIFDWAVKQHASTINLKSGTIPSDYRPIVDDALTKLGYRFRLASPEPWSPLGQRTNADD